MDTAASADLPTKVLLALHADGDEHALGTLVQRYHGFAHDVVRARLGSRFGIEVDDVVQDALVKVLRKIPQYSREGSFRIWLRKVLLSTVNDTLRHETADKRDRRRTKSTEELESSAATPAALRSQTTPTDNALAHELEQRLPRVLESLSERQREVYEMSKVCGASYEEIAEELGITAGNARVILHRTLALIGVELAKRVSP